MIFFVESHIQVCRGFKSNVTIFYAFKRIPKLTGGPSLSKTDFILRYDLFDFYGIEIFAENANSNEFRENTGNGKSTSLGLYLQLT